MNRATALLLLCLIGAGPRVTVMPAEDEQKILHNPDMGWVLYENYVLDQRPGGASTLMSLPDEDFAGVDAMAIMFAWSDVEKAPDLYDFSRVDHAYDYWKRRGKEIQLRMSTESLLWWEGFNPPSGQGVPRYVLDRLGPDKKQRRREAGVDFTVVDAREPYYLQRLATFLAAVNAHFDDKRPVTLIDLRGFGVWGEWHSGYRYASPAGRREALCAIIDIWSNAFPKHWLPISYSHDPDGPRELYAGPNDRFEQSFTSNYEEYLRYSAFDHALSKPNVTFRRDGAGGAVYSNQRKLCDAAFNTLTKGPMMCEFLGGYADNKAGGQKWLEFIVNDALTLHPNYINLVGYQCGDALSFIKEQPELFAHGMRSMGYRLVPTSLTYPQMVRDGEPFDVEMTWVNRAVGRAMHNFRLRLRAGDVACNAGALETTKWIRGRTYQATARVKIEAIKPGTYPIQIELIDPRTEKPIALPLKTAEVGCIEVQ